MKYMKFQNAFSMNRCHCFCQIVTTFQYHVLYKYTKLQIQYTLCHDDVIKWKHFLRYWPFVHGIHRSLVKSPHKGQWCGALMFSLICTWINSWVKQWSDWWFEMPSHPLWHQCNVIIIHPHFATSPVKCEDIGKIKGLKKYNKTWQSTNLVHNSVYFVADMWNI